jgi:hypothetical protein
MEIRMVDEPKYEGIGENIIVIPQGDIQMYSVRTTATQSINQWIGFIVQTLRYYPEDQPCRLLYDFSNVSILKLTTTQFHDIGSLGLSLDGNEQVLNVLNERPRLKVRLAVVVQMSLSAKLATASATRVRKYERVITWTVDKAVSWLRQNSL